MAARPLGNRFRTDDGPQYDIYELTDTVNVDTAKRARTKLYYFNSDTQLLEKVRYTVERNGTTIQVETRLGEWQTSEQQKFPGRITRVESGNAAWTLLVSSVATSPMSEDGIFSRP